MDRRRHRQWEAAPQDKGRLVVLGLALAGAALAGGFAFASGEDPGDLVVAEATEPAEEPTAGTMHLLSPAPLAGRIGVAHAWTGDELLVWGGAAAAPPEESPAAGLRADGAAFDPRTQRWRKLAPAPLTPRLRPAYAWADDRLYVWGGADVAFAPLDDGAVYVPDEDRWEPLPAAPISGRAGAVGVWTGEELLVLGGFQPIGMPERLDPLEVMADGAAYDPRTGSWRVVAAPPRDLAPRDLLDAVWTGEELVALRGTRGAIYRPTRDHWERLELPAGVTASGLTATVALDRRRLAVLGTRPADDADAAGVVYDLVTRGVEPIPGTAPFRPAWPPRLVRVGDELLVLPDRVAPEGRPADAALAWDATNGRWVPLPPVTQGRAGYAAAWTGEELLVWGGMRGTTHYRDGVRWRP